MKLYAAIRFIMLIALFAANIFGVHNHLVKAVRWGVGVSGSQNETWWSMSSGREEHFGRGDNMTSTTDISREVPHKLQSCPHRGVQVTRIQISGAE
ncbi:hypothetical protein L484_013277 [Morus notabilis]|uniref:Uncharacterized protein n=1 Tax=Morus notabilis TaxID=981085 RepID=W9ST48_9ROSA|nr:hypothetical protein L484_013277 [Morus notabilis]